LAMEGRDCSGGEEEEGRESSRLGLRGD
jgi:hypothetical protein